MLLAFRPPLNGIGRVAEGSAFAALLMFQSSPSLQVDLCLRTQNRSGGARIDSCQHLISDNGFCQVSGRTVETTPSRPTPLSVIGPWFTLLPLSSQLTGVAFVPGNLRALRIAVNPRSVIKFSPNRVVCASILQEQSPVRRPWESSTLPAGSG